MRMSRGLIGSALAALIAVVTSAVACGEAAGGGSNLSGGGGSGATSSTGGVGAFSGSGGTMATGGVGAFGGSGGLGPGCATDSYTGEVVPLDMYVLLDRSGSMGAQDTDGGPTRWSQVTNAITEFMALPGTNAIGMGIGFFPVPPSVPPPTNCASPADCYPYGDICFPPGFCPDNISADESCVPGDYAWPAVPVAPLPDVANAINGAMASHSPGDMTPMAPALWGAMTYASGWAQSQPDHVTIVVLATDGMPTSCVDNEVDNIAAIAAGGLANSPSIQTFVIGIGQELTSLNSIAQSGGTTEALIVDTGNTGAEFLAALNAIRGSVACIYKMPTPAQGEADINKLNVAYTPEGGDQQIFPRVGSEGACQGETAWYYDDPAQPTHIILCPAACDRVQSGKGTVDIVLGCLTVVK